MDDSTVVDLDAAPELRDDLFAASNCDGTGDSRECYLELRGYEHERAVVRFLAEHGVRCPYQGSSSLESGSFVTENGGSYFRIRCGPHGD